MERFWLAMSMVVLGVAALAYVYLPPLWHEWLDIALGGIVLCHCAINYRWFCRLMGVGDKGMPVTKMRFTAWSVYQIVLNVLLIISFSVTMVTGILLSKYLFVDIASYTWHRALWVYEWHTAADLPGEGYALVVVTMIGLYALIGYWLGNRIVKNKSPYLKTHLP